MSTTNSIDLTALPPPQSVEVISFETVLAEMLADLRARAPEFNTISEADMVYKILEACAYRETLLRQRENNKARALMLAFATGADLDHIGVTYYNGTQRLTITPGNPAATPPVAAVLEADDDYRRRLLLQPEGESVAGPEGAYVFHALSAHPDVMDASAYSPWPAGVVITLLGRAGHAPSAEAMAAVATQLCAAQVLPSADTPIPTADSLTGRPASYTPDTLRPVADRVILRPATLVPYRIDADIIAPSGPDVGVLVQSISANLRAYKDAPRRLGRDIAQSAIYAAMHLPGVERVTLHQPAADVMLDGTQAPICTAVSVRFNGQEIAL